MQHMYCRAGQEGPWHPLKLAKQFHDFLQKWRAERRGVSVMQMPHMAAFAGLGSYSQVSPELKQLEHSLNTSVMCGHLSCLLLLLLLSRTLSWHMLMANIRHSWQCMSLLPWWSISMLISMHNMMQANPCRIMWQGVRAVSVALCCLCQA